MGVVVCADGYLRRVQALETARKKRSAEVRKRNSRIRAEYFRYIRLHFTAEHALAQITKKYGVSRQTIYNAVTDYYKKSKVL